MTYFMSDDLAMSRAPEGPVASYIIPFSEWLVDRGYGLVSTRNQVLMAAGFRNGSGKRGLS
jgi:integrase/recombinase XerD